MPATDNQSKITLLTAKIAVAVAILAAHAVAFFLARMGFELLLADGPVWPAAATAAVLILSAIKAEPGLIIVAAAATLALYPNAVVAAFMLIAVANSVVMHS